ncbi:M48 family metalloprotease [Bradyrhizobium oligotrophicum]|uniref:M48 family metalloprotease n=1 Tax=Bradyrhizobium oligotrophicum TaxID=44255 RepID=UPI003EB887EC
MEAEGASTLVLVSLAAMTGAWLIFLLPYGALSRLVSGSAGTNDFLEIATAAFASIWVALVVWASGWRQARRQQQMLSYANPLPPSSMPTNPQLQRLLGQARIELRLLGDPDRAIDRGGKITASPRVMAAAGSENRSYIVLLPALSFARLRNDTNALDAVLAHEVAHVVQRDLRLLAGLDTFLRTTLWFVPIAVALTIINSTATDIRDGANAGSALLASILGKSSIAVLPLLILLSLAMLRFTESYREALADSFAAHVIGASALARAENILSANEGGARAWTAFDRSEVLYSWRLIAMYGFSIGALYGYAPSPIAYLHSILPTESPLRLPLSVAFATLATFTIYAAAFVLSYILTSDRSPSSMADSAISRRLLLFATLSVVGGLATQTFPLMLSAVPIFDRFPDVARHDALPLLLANFADSATSIVTCTATGTLCAMASTGGRIGLWFLLGAVAILAGEIEPVLAPQYTFGLASFGVGAALMAYPSWNAVKRLMNASAVTISIATGAVVVIIGSWFGLGGPGCIAVSLEAASASASRAAQLDRAIYLERLATKFAPLNATGFLDLARLELASPAFSQDAIASAEMALRAPYLNGWSERFDVLVTAATSHLERRDPSDWRRAGDLLTMARDMWRRNLRLDPQNGVVLYYNSAIVACHYGADPLIPLGYLVAALGFISDDAKVAGVANAAIEDTDLTCVDLTDLTKPTSSTIDFFRGKPGDGTTESAINQALIHGIDREETARFLRLLIRARTHDNGG